MIMVQFAGNPKLRRIPQLKNPAVQKALREDGCIFGARFICWQLETIWKEDRSPNHSVLSDIERAKVEESLSRYAELLNTLGPVQLVWNNPAENFAHVRPSSTFVQNYKAMEYATAVSANPLNGHNRMGGIFLRHILSTATAPGGQAQLLIFSQYLFQKE